ncbi:MAG: IPT/TIG domain-containing protein, partial [Bacteroidota bacterium]
MRKTTYPISFALGLLLLFFACNRDDTPIVETLEIIPVISSFSPTSGVPGTLVTITGDNFGDLTTTNTVRIGSTIAHVVSATATELTVILPVDAETDTFRITANKNTGTSDTVFVVEEPTLSLNVSQLELFVSESESLVVTNFVGIDEDSPISWTTSDAEVATVDDQGTVTGV